MSKRASRRAIDKLDRRKEAYSRLKAEDKRSRRQPGSKNPRK